MKTALAFALILVSLAMVRLAAADSGCIPPPEPCPPVYDAGTGVCTTTSEIGTDCAGDAGTCGEIPPWCAHHGELTCLGPVPPSPQYTCGSDGGCSITADPARIAGRAALPSFLLLGGALTLLVDRRRRRHRTSQRGSAHQR